MPVDYKVNDIATTAFQSETWVLSDKVDDPADVPESDVDEFAGAGWANAVCSSLRDASAHLVQLRFGSGSPEGAVTGDVGDRWGRTDGGVDTAEYVKTSGSGNTGWTARNTFSNVVTATVAASGQVSCGSVSSTGSITGTSCTLSSTLDVTSTATFDAGVTMDSASPVLNVGSGSGNPELAMRGAGAFQGWWNASLQRTWLGWFTDSSNANLRVRRYIAGVLQDHPITIANATGAITFSQGLTVGSHIVSDTDSTDDLGTTSVRWRAIYGDAAHLTNGSISGASALGNQLVIGEVSGLSGTENRGLTIMAGTTGACRIFFGDSDDVDNGHITYQHGASPVMQFIVDATERCRLTAAELRPLTNGATNLGTSSVRWGTSYVQNANVSTSMQLPVYTDGTRPAAGTAGRIIFNSTDGNLNIDDGTNWILPDGTTT